MLKYGLLSASPALTHLVGSLVELVSIYWLSLHLQHQGTRRKADFYVIVPEKKLYHIIY